MQTKPQMPEIEIESDGLTYCLKNWEEFERYARTHVASFQAASYLAEAWGVSPQDKLKLILFHMTKSHESIREIHLKYVEQLGPLPITNPVFK